MQASSVDSSLKEDHIYATLSETFGSLSSFGDGYMNDDNRCPSVTTIANDDFEFHDPRTSGCSVDIRPMGRNPCLRQQSYSSSSFSSGGDYIPNFGRRVRESDMVELNCARNPHIMSRPPADLPTEAYSHSTVVNKENNSFISKAPSNLVNEKNKLNLFNGKPVPVHNSPQIAYNNYEFESDTLEKKYYMQKHSCDTLENNENEFSNGLKQKLQKDEVSDGTLSRKHRSSSLSMNDLDKLEKEQTANSDDQMMFLLPVKSESMLSLYRLYLAEDEQDSSASLHYSIELSKSENDLSVVTEEQESLSIGRSTEDVRITPHEIYQKRRRPQSSASKVRRQHKIQRAKGLHTKNKPQIIPSQQLTPVVPRPVSKNNAADNVDYGVQVAIMDKSRRKNGIITIRDPSGLSVQELFSVLNRATAATTTSAGTLTNPTTVSGVTTIPIQDQGYQKLSTENPSLTLSARQPEFKKIFVSEYL